MLGETVTPTTAGATGRGIGSGGDWSWPLVRDQVLQGSGHKSASFEGLKGGASGDIRDPPSRALDRQSLPSPGCCDLGTQVTVSPQGSTSVGDEGRASGGLWPLCVPRLPEQCCFHP